MAPTIAVIAGREPPHRYSLHKGYIDALWAVGAMPIVLTPLPVQSPTTGISPLWPYWKT